MNNVSLYRDDVEAILTWINKYPDSEWVTISVDSSSGIGSIVKARLNAVVNEDMVTVEKTFADERGW